jgi:hypothetical protein
MAINPKSLQNLRAGQKRGKSKFTNLKQSFLDAFEQMGGTKGLKEWGMKPQNRTAFYQMIAKMLPSKIDAEIHEKKVVIMHLPAKLPKGQE